MAITAAAIVAMDEGRVIGRENRLPWHLPEDLQRFSELTRGETVLMGRRTYESLPERFRPLPQRKNIVVTRSSTPVYPQGVEVCADPLALIEDAKAGRYEVQGTHLWIIGGAAIYEVTKPLWDEVYLTLVRGHHQGDAFLPPFEENFEVISREERADFSYLHYRRK